MPLTLTNARPGRPQPAFTLIELIGVLAVLALLAAALVPVFIRRLDRVAGDRESAALKSLADALTQSATRWHAIPAHTNWAPTAATELGVSTNNVTVNGRGLPRYVLIDPGWQIGSATAGQAYQQTSAGCAAFTNSPRLLILSSIGQPLPNMVSGVPSAADFNAIWDWNDASSTPPAAAVLSGLTKADDLKVQRVNFTGLFVHLILTTYASSAGARYSIDSTNWSTATTVPSGSGIDAYFIQGTVLGLHTHLGVLDSQQILIRDGSFVYNENVWRGSILGGSMVAGLDVGSIVDKFLSAPANPNATGGATQQGVVQAMMDYMNAYEAWAAAGFPGGPLKNTASSSQNTMMNVVSGLYNNPPEVACP